MTDANTTPATLTVQGADPLSGRFATPGDIAISQRALLLAALTVGVSSISGLRASSAVLACVAALRQMGVTIEQNGDDWRVHGLGVAGLLEPEDALAAGQSAHSAALLMGLMTPYGFTTQFGKVPTLRGDAMAILNDSLSAIGASVERRSDGRMSLRGACLPLPVRQRFETPAPTVKTALLLAGLQMAGAHEIYESVATQDHTEKLMAAFGADITTTPDEGHGDGVTIRFVGLPELKPQVLSVPGDPSAAAFGVVAALIVKGSDLVIENVLINPLRTGLIDTLLEMGGDIQFINQREIAGEHIADLRVRSSWLKGVRVDPRHAGAMLDDIAPLAIAAAYAQGETVIEGLQDLSGPDDDRLAAIAAGLSANKVGVTRNADSLIIAGEGKVGGGGRVRSGGDAAIAMSFAVLGLASRHRVSIEDAEAITASFPDFVATMTQVGGHFPPSKGR